MRSMWKINCYLFVIAFFVADIGNKKDLHVYKQPTF